MGILNLNQAQHKVADLDHDQVINAAKAKAKDRGREANPTVYVDASIVGCKHGQKGQDDAAALATTVESFLQEGAKVDVTFDPLGRHHSKAASVKRCGERELARLNAITKRVELIRLGHTLNSPDATEAASAEWPRGGLAISSSCNHSLQRQIESLQAKKFCFQQRLQAIDLEMSAL